MKVSSLQNPERKRWQNLTENMWMVVQSFTEQQRKISSNAFESLNGTVSAISSDPPCIEDNAWVSTVSLKIIVSVEIFVECLCKLIACIQLNIPVCATYTPTSAHRDFLLNTRRVYSHISVLGQHTKGLRLPL